MILNEKQLVNITNRNITNYTNLGYDCEIGSTCLIYIKDLATKQKINCSCDSCDSIYTVSKAKSNETNLKYCKNCRWLVYGKLRKAWLKTDDGMKSNVSRGKSISKGRVGKGLKPESHWVKNNEYKGYKNNVKRHQRKWLNHLKNVDNYDKIGRNGGNSYQIDHIISKRYGYDNNIDPYVIAHICNLRIITWQENNKKSNSCSMKIHELIELINLYNKRKNSNGAFGYHSGF